MMGKFKFTEPTCMRQVTNWAETWFYDGKKICKAYFEGACRITLDLALTSSSATPKTFLFKYQNDHLGARGQGPKEQENYYSM